MGFGRSEAGKEIGFMVFTPPAIVNLFRLTLCGRRGGRPYEVPRFRRHRRAGHCARHTKVQSCDNFVYALSHSYNFVTRC